MILFLEKNQAFRENEAVPGLTRTVAPVPSYEMEIKGPDEEVIRTLTIVPNA